MYPPTNYGVLNDPKIKFPSKQVGEIRLVGMDVATSGGKNNDASCIVVMQLIPYGNKQYYRNIVYMETMDGGHTYDQALRLRQIYEDYQADYIILDTNGVGIGVYDNLVQDQRDEDRNLIYPSLSCINDSNMASRSKNPGERKVIYSIKATQKFNSDAAVLLRDGFRRGKIRLLVDERDSEKCISRSKSYQSLSPEDQAMLDSPYIQTSCFINEAVNLSYENTADNKIKVYEPSNMRKDRYSAISYTNYIASEIERGIRKQENFEDFLNIPMCVSSVNF